MKPVKKIFIPIIAFLLAAALLFSACSKGGTDFPSQTEAPDSSSSAPETETENTEEPSTSKYSMSDNLVALTFDDGPGYSSTLKILDALEQNNSVATFFVVGYNLDEHPEVTKKAFDMGCEIGNHTNDHKYLTKCSAEQRDYQINENNRKIKEITGADCKLLRAPGGLDKGLSGAVDMPFIAWDIDTNDWKLKDASHKGRSDEQRNADIDGVVNHVMSNLHKGDIILMHDIYDFSADVAVRLIPEIVAAGYKLVTVSEMFEAYGTEVKAGSTYRSAQIVASENHAIVKPGAYIVNTSSGGLNLRDSSGTGSNIIAEIPKGTVVMVTESVEGWAKVTHEGKTGWVSTAYLRPAD